MIDHSLRPRTARRRALGVALAVTLVTAACGGNDDDTAGDDIAASTTDAPATETTAVSTTEAPATTQPATEPTIATTEPTTATTEPTTETTDDTTADDADDSIEPAATEAFCQAVIETQGVLTTGPEVDFETATGDEIAAAMEEYGGRLLPVLDELAGAVPDEVADDVDALSGVLRDSLESGAEPFNEPEFVEADRNIDAYMIDNCGYEIVTVAAVDYRFEDVPDSVAAGTVGFDFRNNGTEVHEMVLFRIADGVELSVEELLELPEDEVESMVEFRGVAFAASGEEDVTFAALEPGRHVLLCFIPIGTTSMDMLEGDAPPDSPPHFTQGMVHEFEVT